MKDSFTNIFSKFISGCIYKPRKGINQGKSESLSFLKVRMGRTEDYFRELYVKNLFHYNLPSIDVNERIIDSLKFFQSPFKISLLVCEDKEVVGTLHLSDVITNLNASISLKSSFCSNVPVRCIMNREFVPLDYNLSLSDIVVDILNCECLMHPVYHNSYLKGVLHKETVLDIVKFQMLNEAIQK